MFKMLLQQLWLGHPVLWRDPLWTCRLFFFCVCGGVFSPSMCLASRNAIFCGGRRKNPPTHTKKKSRQVHRGSRQRTGCPNHNCCSSILNIVFLEISQIHWMTPKSLENYKVNDNPFCFMTNHFEGIYNFSFWHLPQWMLNFNLIKTFEISKFLEETSVWTVIWNIYKKFAGKIL